MSNELLRVRTAAAHGQFRISMNDYYDGPIHGVVSFPECSARYVFDTVCLNPSGHVRVWCLFAVGDQEPISVNKQNLDYPASGVSIIWNSENPFQKYGHPTWIAMYDTSTERLIGFRHFDMDLTHAEQLRVLSSVDTLGISEWSMLLID